MRPTKVFHDMYQQIVHFQNVCILQFELSPCMVVLFFDFLFYYFILLTPPNIHFSLHGNFSVVGLFVEVYSLRIWHG